MTDHFYYLSLGAGKQSSALALMIANKDKRLPKEFYDAKIIFADTGHEKTETYEWIKKLSEMMDIIIINRGYSLLDYFYKRGQVPMGWVYPLCSSHFKRDFIQKYYRQQHGKRSKNGNYGFWHTDVIIHEIMGIGIEEAQRMKSPREKWLKKEYPLIDLKLDREACIQIIEEYMGWNRETVLKNIPKSSCTFCPNQSNKTLRVAHKLYPKDFEYALKVQENAIEKNSENPPLWKPKQSLHDILFNEKHDDDIDDICDSGYCFV